MTDTGQLPKDQAPCEAARQAAREIMIAVVLLRRAEAAREDDFGPPRLDRVPISLDDEIPF